MIREITSDTYTLRPRFEQALFFLGVALLLTTVAEAYFRHISFQGMATAGTLGAGFLSTAIANQARRDHLLRKNYPQLFQAPQALPITAKPEYLLGRVISAEDDMLYHAREPGFATSIRKSSMDESFSLPTSALFDPNSSTSIVGYSTGNAYYLLTPTGFTAVITGNVTCPRNEIVRRGHYTSFAVGEEHIYLIDGLRGYYRYPKHTAGFTPLTRPSYRRDHRLTSFTIHKDTSYTLYAQEGSIISDFLQNILEVKDLRTQETRTYYFREQFTQFVAFEDWIAYAHEGHIYLYNLTVCLRRKEALCPITLPLIPAHFEFLNAHQIRYGATVYDFTTP